MTCCKEGNFNKPICGSKALGKGQRRGRGSTNAQIDKTSFMNVPFAYFDRSTTWIVYWCLNLKIIFVHKVLLNASKILKYYKLATNLRDIDTPAKSVP